MVIAFEQFEVAACVEAIWGELSGMEVSGSVFFRRGIAREGTVRGEFT